MAPRARLRGLACAALLLVTGLFAATAAAQNATTVTITGSRPATFARVGQVLTFNVQLYTGNTPINSLTFTSGSPTPMSGLNCPGVPADLLTTTNCTFTYTTTSMDMAMGTITALGRWTATRPGASRSGSTNTLKVSYAPPREPDAPVVGTAVAGDSQATVAFSAPYFDGGWPVDGYTVTASPGGKTANGTASPITVTGLTNGTAYQFTVSATNVIGTGTSSATSNIVTPTSPQTITFANPGSQDFGTTPTLAATASSGLAVAFSSGTTDVCTTTSGGALTLVAAGTCTINANQAGNAAFAAAPQVSQSFSVNAVAPGAPVIGTATVDGAEATVAFTPPVVSGGTAVTSYTVTSSPGALTATGSDSPITLAGLDYGTVYTFTVTATNPAGTGVASAASNAVTPKASQAITFNNPGAQAFGTSPTLTATSSAGLAVSFSSATTGVCTIDAGGTLTFVTAGTCTVEADQPGDAATLAATTVSRSFTVTPVVPGAPSVGTATAGEGQASVTFTAPAFTGGAAIVAYTVTSTSGGATATGAGSPITVTGLTNGTAYAFTVTATNTAGTGAASAATNLVTPASSQTITFGNPGAQNYGTSPTLTATSSSGLPVAFTSSSTAVCTITTGGALTFVAAGTCSINADQAGDSAHLPAPQVSRSFSVNPVAPGAPRSVAAVAGNAQAVVSFDAPANVGGAAITGYTVTSSPGGVIVSGAGSPITVTGLANGTAYTFTVTASNSAGTGSASVASNTVTPAPPLVARPVSATLAYDAPASPVALDITGTPTGVAVDSAPSHGTAVATGTTITYQPTAGYAGPDSFTYTASDGINTSASATVTITVAEPILALAPAAPPAATGSTAYAHAFAASGGAAPYTFVLASGALPDGLVLDADGTLSGTPVQDGSFSFTIEATDSSTGTGPFSARQAYTLDVQAPAIAFALSLPEITFGDHIEQTVQASGGTAPYTFAVLGGELPPGVALSTAGLLSGAPEAAGRFEATIEVRDANDFAAQRDIELLIERAAQAITGFTANPSEPVFAPAGTFELSAQGGTSGNPIVFASTTPAVCTVEADTVTMRAAGRCSLTADQAGDANRDAAPQVALDVDIAAAVPTLVWPEQLSKVLGEPAFELDNPESDSAGAFTFGSSQPDVASISGRTVTLNGPGTTVITATQAADGSYATASIEMQLVVVERPDPTRDPGVTGLLQAQVDASVRFANAQQANIRDRLRQVRSGSNASSGNLTLAYAGGENAQGLSMPVGQAVSSAWPAMSPGWGAWLSGTATFGSNGRANGFDFETDGITLGVDRAIGGNLLVGIAGSLATNQSELDDNASRLDADQRSLALYGLWRAGEHVFVDGMVGTGRLDFDIRRWSNDADALGTAARDGDQWFASLATGYEHHGPSMTLTGYGRLDTSRTTLDGYREFGLDLYDLEYRQQVVESSTVAVGLEGNWRIGGDAGRVSPFWSVEYREALQNQGEAAINYVIWPSATDYRLRMDSYNDHALALAAGLDFTLRRGWLLSVLLGHEQARNASDASSIGLRLSYSGQPIAIDPVVSADEVLSGPPDR